MIEARRLRLPASALLVGAMALGLVVPSCTDPVHDQAVQALGPENPQIPPGQYHRAGQPCTVCHGPEGPAQTQFSIAGTVFGNPYIQEQANGPTGSVGYNNAFIAIADDNGQIAPPIYSNCVGNFWATPAAFTPAYPILVQVYPAGQTTNPQVMFTQIGRAGSCAECHADPPNFNAVGHVYIDGKGPTAYAGDSECPVEPDLSQLQGGIP
jgi:hypothetical protein